MFPGAERQPVLRAIRFEPLGDFFQLGQFDAQRHEHRPAAVDSRHRGQIFFHFSAIGRSADDELELIIVLGDQPFDDLRIVPIRFVPGDLTRIAPTASSWKVSG